VCVETLFSQLKKQHIRYNTSFNWIFIDSKRDPCVFDLYVTSNISLLALDISANFLGALLPVLADCENLEELNVSSNSLRVLPVFLADLINLRVFFKGCDSTGISTLPETIVDFDKLHTVSVRACVEIY
jgi:hypothetical protein